MPLKGWGKRRRRPEENPIENDPDSVDLSASEYSWWTERDLEGGVPEGGQGSSRRKGRRGPTPAEKKHSTFEDYFSSESLFRPAAEETKPNPIDDPYGTLGVSRSATWDEIVAAHRRLVKEHHPDRLGDVGGEQRAESDAIIRDLNVAIAELRKRRGAR